jgi:hypothetical protein
MDNEFKKFDFVYDKRWDRFGIVRENPRKIMMTVAVDVYSHNGIGPSLVGVEHWWKHNTIKCQGPDTPQNRLAIQLKYS